MLLRQLAVALLFNENHEVLFLQKKADAAFLPGHLVPIGGHLQAAEIGDPQRAALREIEEETGLTSPGLNSLALRYVVHQVRTDKEISIQYIFTGRVAAGSSLLESAEGSLVWAGYSGLERLVVTASTKEVLGHYLRTGIHTNEVYVGTMHLIHGKPAAAWAILQDLEGQVRS
ncbi:NUDIX domain-containing protein [Paenibacillus sp. MMS20-IR301]|uniref:NUDIX hydrolase n=1 Tax=Paenibacillus sp. MMS20-IR301 TaxID=2895946 RepID=UPI0028E46953|nr:NUDIX domain-containing protein [Paenibacillus sp. MMS20-IR301]WNS41343.1 NUDIX domain-containing protein [Paenibacillus sp. MMS20-IR301]